MELATPLVTADSMAFYAYLIGIGKKFAAMRAYRQDTGASLVDVRDFILDLDKRMNARRALYNRINPDHPQV